MNEVFAIFQCEGGSDSDRNRIAGYAETELEAKRICEAGGECRLYHDSRESVHRAYTSRKLEKLGVVVTIAPVKP